MGRDLGVARGRGVGIALGTGTTCIVASFVTPPYVAVIVASPGLTALSSPVALSTRATFGSEDENVEFWG